MHSNAFRQRRATKLLLVMKMTTFLLLCFFVQVSARTMGQVTIKEKSATLESVLAKVKKQQKDYGITYEVELVRSKGRPVSVDVSNVPLERALEEIFRNQDQLSYVLIGKVITVKAKEVLNAQVVTGDLSPRLEIPLPPPTKDITGKVTDTEGKPLVGASIKVKDSKTGTQTNADGVFTLNAKEGDVITVSFIGYESRQITLTASILTATNTLTITLKPAVTKLDDVEVTVNTGYQSIPKERATGSFFQLNNEQVNRIVSTDILSRLQNVSGLLYQGSQLGDNRNNIVIRGYSTILSNRQPLIVVDDFPFDADINSINPNDIEKITVLKDAAAASIWGARASNGVIVITTKGGKYNQGIKVSVNSNITFEQKPDLFYAPTLSSSDYVDIETFLFNKGFYNSNISSLSRPALTPAIEILQKRLNGQITAQDSVNQLNALRQYDLRNDLKKYYYQQPIRQQYAINISGGGRYDKHYLSVGYDQNQNTTNNYSRLSIYLANTYSLLKNRLVLSSSVQFASTQINDFADRYQNGFNYPYARLADESGKALPIALHRQGYIDTAGGGQLLDWNYYPLTEKNHANRETVRNDYRVNADITYKLLNGLNIAATYQYMQQPTDVNNLYTLQSYFARDLVNLFTNLNQTSPILRNPVPVGGILDQTNEKFTSQNLRVKVNYNKEWNQVHRIIAMGGAEVGDIAIKSNSTRYYGYNNENATNIPIDYVNTYRSYIDGNMNRIPNVDLFKGISNRAVSTFANAAYSYKDRYTASLSGRRDGANIFGTSTNNKWKPFWSAGFKWDIDKERFFHIGWVSSLKLRTTYGYQGNSNNAVAALMTIRYNSGTNRYQLPSASIQNPPNPDLRWEKVSQYNVGIDYALFNHRISGSLDYYFKKGTDLIGDEQLAPSSGNTSLKTNSADMKGHGLDLVINTKNLTGKIGWETSLLFSIAKDRITNYKSVVSNIQTYVEEFLGVANPVVGKPVSALYSYRWAGLNAIGDPQGFLNHQPSNSYSQLITSPDLNDMVYSGPKTPPYFGNIMNTFTWKQLSLSFNITYRFGHYFRRSSIFYNSLFNGGDNGNTDYNLRWQKPGDESITNVPSMVYPANPVRDAFYRYAEVLVEKGDHIRLQDIRLSYDISKKQISKLPMENIRFYVYASNLGILWRANKRNIDPDYQLPNSYMPGLPGRAIVMGLKVDF